MFEEFIRASLKFFRYYKTLGEGALAQICDDELHLEPQPGANSVAVIIKHVSGNMHSRWSDLFGSDGESVIRNRDLEFIDDTETRAQILERWEAGWTVLFRTLESLQPDELLREIRIRHEAITVLEAVQRQLAHYPYHVGQIVLIAKMFRGEAWQSLSIPKGGSSQFNAAMMSKKPDL
jgi:hypothetical protein